LCLKNGHTEEPRYLWYCGTKKYRKGDGTGTVEKWYHSAAVVPWYRATLLCSMLVHNTVVRAVRNGKDFWLLLTPGAIDLKFGMGCYVYGVRNDACTMYFQTARLMLSRHYVHNTVFENFMIYYSPGVDSDTFMF